MYVNEATFKGWEAVYGSPGVFQLDREVSKEEIEMIIASQRGQRAHDVTFFILEGDKLAVIAKHSYPPGVYRAPGGGLAPGESLEIGGLREAKEETGLDIALDRYLVRAHVRFFAGEKTVDWTTHVFSARTIGGRLEVGDTDEIRQARTVSLAEVQGPIRQAMLDTGRRLLAYRVWLTDQTIAALEALPQAAPT